TPAIVFVVPDAETYEQIELQADFVGEERAAYLTDGMSVRLEFHEDRAISLELPKFVTLEVEMTEPVVKGQTAANSFKPATLVNGTRTTVPPFVGIGEMIVISTEDGSYSKRAD
ncbi:MAG: elongation factor P, partial [Maricaulis sp.]|nr:elongation factor P [Maricaulis sp.]